MGMEKSPESQPLLTKENLPQIKERISNLREQPGHEQEVLSLISKIRGFAYNTHLDEDAVDLYWEEFLIQRHLGNVDAMVSVAKEADEYIQEFSVETKRARNYRFMSEASIANGNFKTAVDQASQGIRAYANMEDPRERVNVLEIRGILAEATIRMGDIDKGVNIGLATLEEFNRDDGQLLKDRDYYTWAVWKSGVIVKMWNAILDTGQNLPNVQKEQLLSDLDQTEQSLNVNTTGMPSNFEIRKKQIANIREKLS